MITRRNILAAPALLLPKPAKAWRLGSAPVALNGNFILNPEYDSSWSSATTGATAAVVRVINFLQNLIQLPSSSITPLTINVHLYWGATAWTAATGLPLGGIAESDTLFSYPTTYASLKAALLARALTTDAINAAATLPTSDPLSAATYVLTYSHAVMLGLAPYNSAADVYVGFASNVTWDVTSSGSSGNYDFQSELAHEITEGLGRQLIYGQTFSPYNPSYGPLDLFRYSASGTRQTGNATASPSYFSFNGGVTNLNTFNATGVGDAWDWSTAAGPDSFNYINSPGVINPFTAVDKQLMNIIGYNTNNSVVWP